MTDTELSELEAKAKAATPGPWKYEDPIIVRELSEISWQGVDIDKRQNMAFIATANPAAILELIAELRQTKAERDWLAKQLENQAICLKKEYSDDELCRLHSCFCYKIETKTAWLEAAKEATHGV